ncbi:MAG: glycoside hydrolase family 15 protein [Planctomycetota bacterium]
MPRDLPVGNGQMLVCFDKHYRLRDLYFPFVGQENHAAAPCRFGAFADCPVDPEQDPDGRDERRKRRLFWSDDGWDLSLRYQTDTLATDVTMTHPLLRLRLHCTDVVDFHRCLLVRRVDITDTANLPADQTGDANSSRTVRLFHHHDFHMYGTKVGDTAYFDPQLRSLIHYRKNRYLMACFYQDGDQQTDEYATGTSGFGGAEGTYRDAEDGQLGGNPIAQGAVDSTMMVRVVVPAGGTRTVYMVVGAGKSYDDLDNLHKFLHRESPHGVIDRTRGYWKLWLDSKRPLHLDGDARGGSGEPAGASAANADALPAPVHQLYRRSLLTVKTQCDARGAILAANDSDILQFSRDTYSYLWPRDGAFVADAMSAAGFPEVAEGFFRFCDGRLHRRGMFLHKYNPDGSPASSWHPWVDRQGRPQMPIQEDETALVLWALWRHYQRKPDIGFVRPKWSTLIEPAANFLVQYRDPATKLPLPSYDLWEERYGVHAFTVATAVAGLRAAAHFAHRFDQPGPRDRYNAAADEITEAFVEHFWCEKNQRFHRRITPEDADRNGRLMGQLFAGQTPNDPNGSEVAYEPDDNIDASMFAIFALDMLPVGDPKVQSTMSQVRDRLTVKTKVGGVARYLDDYYHQVSDDIERIPGNPWFICTLWVADYDIARAQNRDELRQAGEALRWVADRALPSGVLAEQVHPLTNAPLSVSPLTWSHATVVSTVTKYLARWSELGT